MSNSIQLAKQHILEASKHVRSSKARHELRAAYQALLNIEKTMRAPVRKGKRGWQPSASMLAARAEAMNTGKVVHIAR